MSLEMLSCTKLKKINLDFDFVKSMRQQIVKGGEGRCERRH
jgi:hypothetical protein